MSKSLSLAVLCFSTLIMTNGMAENDDPLIAQDVSLSAPVERKVQRKSPTIKASFAPFTGKVVGDKVRMRLQPDLDGYVVQSLSKNDLVSIVDQEGDFYCVEPEGLKAYVFRSFVLDNVVEGNRVNVRLEPDLEAPIIGHLNSGDRVEGEVCPQNRKWLEITPPSSARFYVAKQLIENVGGPEYKSKMIARKESADQLLEAAVLFAKSEMESPFEEIEFEKIKQGFLTIINDYSEFPKKVEKAKLALIDVQEKYLEKRIDYLEAKAALVANVPVSEERAVVEKAVEKPSLLSWSSVEEGLFASWAAGHSGQSKDEFYEEQRTLATAVSGVLEPFKSPVKHKPGDYVLKNKNLPVAYVYSTALNLEDYVGKQVTLIASPRSSHSFAFPAYFVHEVE